MDEARPPLPQAETANRIISNDNTKLHLNIRRAAEITKNNVQRSAGVIAHAETSRYVLDVIAETSRYFLNKARLVSVAMFQHDLAWSYADEIVSGERWLTLGWYERQLVSPLKKEEHLIFAQKKEYNNLIMKDDSGIELSDFERDGYANWVRLQAENKRDEEAMYHVAKMAVVKPAVWTMASACALCGTEFSARCRRHHCRLCGKSVCRLHGSRYRKLPALAPHLGSEAHRVCDECNDIMQELATCERAAWRVARVIALLTEERDKKCVLRPYFDIAIDTASNKARRCLKAALAVARSCPLLAPASATVAVEVLEILCKYGPAGLATLVLRREFVEAAELLRRVARVDAAWPLTAHELTAAIYYLLALNRGERGSNPDAEKLRYEHIPITEDSTLVSLASALPAALWCYCATPSAIDLVARQQGLVLLFEHAIFSTSSLESCVAQPAFICLATKDSSNLRKRAVLAIRGTASVHDVATDVRAFPAPFPPRSLSTSQVDSWTSVESTCYAFAGMGRAAQWVYDETSEALFALASNGYDLELTGHSLGAGVASLLTIMLRRGLDDRGLTKSKLHCYCFATPACVDVHLADQTKDLVTSVVLHDDVVPRLTARALRRLMAQLLRQRETCMRRWRDDLDAVWGRLRNGLWAPRWRDSLLLDNETQTVKSSKSLARTNPTLKTKKRVNVSTQTESDEDIFHDACQVNSSERKRHRTARIAALAAAQAAGVAVRCAEETKDDDDQADTSSESTSSDDEFRDCLQEDNDEDNIKERAIISNQAPIVVIESDKLTPALLNTEEDVCPEFSIKDFDDVDKLPELFIPGSIVHIYSWRGVYEAALVPRDCPTLSDIAVSANMIRDHKIQSYFDAINEVLEVRKAPEQPPPWQPFHDTDSCSCCQAKFTWHVTSSSEAQQYREKHNCRNCGLLVCDPCSQQRKPLPRLGLLEPSRICDRCHFHAVSTYYIASTSSSSSASSLIEEEEASFNSVGCNTSTIEEGD